VEYTSAAMFAASKPPSRRGINVPNGHARFQAPSIKP
jgi:hypothetical protein